MSRPAILSVEEIVSIFMSCEPVKVLAHRFDTTTGTISRIQNREQQAGVTAAVITNAMLATMAAWPGYLPTIKLGTKRRASHPIR